MKRNQTIISYCNECRRKTNHNVLFVKEIHGELYDGELQFCNEYSVIQCCGCDSVSFRQESSNSEDYNPLTGEYDTKVEIFPQKKYGSLDVYSLPTIVGDIYKETCVAISNNNPILAGAGTRSIIEAICKYEGITGRLETKINKLSKAGKITTKEVKYLHAIRFLGNDAIHDFYEPTPEQLSIAIRIVESLLSKYALESDAIHNLYLPIDSYQEFKTLVLRLAKKTKRTDFTIDELLEEGHYRRLIIDSNLFSSFKQQFDDDITNNTITTICRIQDNGEPRYMEKNNHT